MYANIYVCTCVCIYICKLMETVDIQDIWAQLIEFAFQVDLCCTLLSSFSSFENYSVFLAFIRKTARKKDEQ